MPGEPHQPGPSATGSTALCAPSATLSPLLRAQSGSKGLKVKMSSYWPPLVRS